MQKHMDITQPISPSAVDTVAALTKQMRLNDNKTRDVYGKGLTTTLPSRILSFFFLQNRPHRFSPMKSRSMRTRSSWRRRNDANFPHPRTSQVWTPYDLISLLRRGKQSLTVHFSRHRKWLRRLLLTNNRRSQLRLSRWKRTSPLDWSQPHRRVPSIQRESCKSSLLLLGQ